MHFNCDNTQFKNLIADNLLHKIGKCRQYNLDKMYLVCTFQQKSFSNLYLNEIITKHTWLYMIYTYMYYTSFIQDTYILHYLYNLFSKHYTLKQIKLLHLFQNLKSFGGCIKKLCISIGTIHNLRNLIVDFLLHKIGRWNKMYLVCTRTFQQSFANLYWNKIITKHGTFSVKIALLFELSNI